VSVCVGVHLLPVLLKSVMMIVLQCRVCLLSVCLCVCLSVSLSVCRCAPVTCIAKVCDDDCVAVSCLTPSVKVKHQTKTSTKPLRTCATLLRVIYGCVISRN